MTERTMQLALCRRWRPLCAMVLPNVHVFGWESDFVTLSRAGYLTEIEIKVSHADFLADARKTVSRGPRRWYGDRAPTTKHEALTSGSILGRTGKACVCERPSRFFYACPAGMLALDEVPEWAGLLEVDAAGRVKELRKARRLHAEPATAEQLERMHASAYHRFLALWVHRAEDGAVGKPRTGRRTRRTRKTRRRARK